jgi:hypothetical protein
MIRECKLNDAPSYFDYWASGDTKERCANHYAAVYGVIPMSLCLSFNAKKLNDGNVYVLNRKWNWRYPENYPL